MAITVFTGPVPTRAQIAVMVRKHEDSRIQARVEPWKGKHNGSRTTASTKISHDQRKARVIARSIAADPKNKSISSKKK